MTRDERARVLRAIATMVAVPALIGLTGCTNSGGQSVDAGYAALETRIAALPDVRDAKASGSYNGLPTSRNLDLRISVENAPSADLPTFVDSVLRAAWAFEPYSPKSVSVAMLDASTPVPTGTIPRPVDLEDAALSLGIAKPTMTKNALVVSGDALETLYGPWPGPTPTSR